MKGRPFYRTKILDHLFPGPLQLENLSDLIDFKHTYRDQLVRFRHFVESFLLNMETFPPEQHDERIERFLVDVNQQRAEIIARMRDYRWRQIGFGALCVLAISLIPIVGSTSAQDSYIGTFDAALGIGSAVMSALSNSQLQVLERHPLAYALLVDKKLPFRVHGSEGTTLYELDNQHILRNMFRQS